MIRRATQSRSGPGGRSNIVSVGNGIVSPPGVARAVRSRISWVSTGKQLSEAGAAFKFGPAEGAQFFAPHGWEPKDVQGLLKTAAQFKRPPVELLSLLPEPKGNFGNYPWTGVCLLSRR